MQSIPREVSATSAKPLSVSSVTQPVVQETRMRGKSPCQFGQRNGNISTMRNAGLVQW